jgi:hypothetical protein
MNNGNGVTERNIPPYVPYKTLRNFIDGMGQVVPGRIDRSLMGTLSGATQGQLVAALRYLDLIDDAGKPQDSLTQLVTASGTSRQPILRAVLEKAYPYLLKHDNGFDLITATPRQLSDCFAGTGATGATVRRCELFFLSAAEDAGIEMSSYISKRQARSSIRKNQKAVGRRKAIRSQDQTESESSTTSAPVSPQPLSWPQMLLAKFPAFDPNWPDELKANWFEDFNRLMTMGDNSK